MMDALGGLLSNRTKYSIIKKHSHVNRPKLLRILGPLVVQPLIPSLPILYSTYNGIKDFLNPSIAPRTVDN